MKHEDPFASMFEKAIMAINSRYIPGSLEYGRRAFPSIYGEIEWLEKHLNKIWMRGSENGHSLRDFRNILRRWYQLHLTLIEKYKKQGKHSREVGTELDITV